MNKRSAKNITQEVKQTLATRKEQAAATRKNIITATENLIKKKGYEAIRVSDVAKACDMSVGNLYYHFKSLDDLFEEIDSIKFYESFNSLKPNNSGSAISRLESYFNDWIELTVTYYGSNYMNSWARHYSTNTSTSAFKNRIDLVSKHITQILDDGVKKGEFRSNTPVEYLSYTIAFSLFGCSAYYGSLEDDTLIRRWKEEFSENFIKTALIPFSKSMK